MGPEGGVSIFTNSGEGCYCVYFHGDVSIVKLHLFTTCIDFGAGETDVAWYMVYSVCSCGCDCPLVIS